MAKPCGAICPSSVIDHRCRYTEGHTGQHACHCCYSWPNDYSLDHPAPGALGTTQVIGEVLYVNEDAGHYKTISVTVGPNDPAPQAGMQAKVTWINEPCPAKWFTAGGLFVRRAWFRDTPDDERAQVQCALKEGHKGPHDPQLGEWR
jgi:hypothetical protein